MNAAQRRKQDRQKNVFANLTDAKLKIAKLEEERDRAVARAAQYESLYMETETALSQLRVDILAAQKDADAGQSAARIRQDQLSTAAREVDRLRAEVRDLQTRLDQEIARADGNEQAAKENAKLRRRLAEREARPARAQANRRALVDALHIPVEATPTEEKPAIDASVAAAPAEVVALAEVETPPA